MFSLCSIVAHVVDGSQDSTIVCILLLFRYHAFVFVAYLKISTLLGSIQLQTPSLSSQSVQQGFPIIAAAILFTTSLPFPGVNHYMLWLMFPVERRACGIVHEVIIEHSEVLHQLAKCIKASQLVPHVYVVPSHESCLATLSLPMPEWPLITMIVPAFS